jgi:hypothetical protein
VHRKNANEKSSGSVPFKKIGKGKKERPKWLLLPTDAITLPTTQPDENEADEEVFCLLFSEKHLILLRLYFCNFIVME